MKSISLTWERCGDDNHWCDLLRLDLESISVDSGVYVIWHGGNNPKYVRVGQGNIKDRVSKHRNDPDILKYKQFGLFVTYASVGVTDLDGVEAFLGEILNPLVGDRFPDRTPISVNLPGK